MFSLPGIAKTAARTISVGAAASALIYSLVSLLPGDAIGMIERDIGKEAAQAERVRLGLDKPIWERYLGWLGAALRGDFGHSFTNGLDVIELLKMPLFNTFILGVMSAFLVVIMGLALGIFSGLQAGKPFDKAITTVTMSLYSVPEFVVAIVLSIIFAVILGWLQPIYLVPLGQSIFSRPQIFVLPAATISLVTAAYVARMIRPIVAAQLHAPHVEAARLCGIRESRVVSRHLLPSTVPGIIQVFTIVVPYLLGGSVVVEVVFAYPGMASLLVHSVQGRDLPVVTAIAVFLAIAGTLALSAADALGRHAAVNKIEVR